VVLLRGPIAGAGRDGRDGMCVAQVAQTLALKLSTASDISLLAATSAPLVALLARYSSTSGWASRSGRVRPGTDRTGLVLWRRPSRRGDPSVIGDRSTYQLPVGRATMCSARWS